MIALDRRAREQKLVHDMQQGLIWQLSAFPVGSHRRGALLYCQLQVTTPSSMSGAHSCVASASIRDAPSPCVLHVLVSNQSRRSMPTPPSMQLVVRLHVHSTSTGGSSGVSELSFATPFPSTRWTKSSTMHVPITLDSHMLEQARVHVKVAVRVETEADGDGQLHATAHRRKQLARSIA
jgi:hypothetical protein